MRPHTPRSLSAHLRETEEHSRLPFHPACPVCRRDRIAGSLDGDELVSRRTRAAIAAGLLALSTGGVPSAVASPPDEISEGTEEIVDGGDSSTSVDFDPGAETVQLPDEATAAPEASAPPADEDAGPLEQEPGTDVREQVVEAESLTTEPAAESPPSPDPAPVSPAPTAEAPDATAPAASESEERKQNAGPVAEGGWVRQARLGGRANAGAPSKVAAPAPAPEPPPAAQAVPVAEPTAASQTAPAPAVPVSAQVASSDKGGAARGARFHTVRPGESLWSIAADLLGDRATVPRIAREVNRLWELNDERIGTGRPDLLFAGTRLRLQ
jgi:hypothetical protein